MVTSPLPIRLLIVDDNPTFLMGLRRFLAKIAFVEVVGEANNGRDALTLVDELQPDVALIDLALPEVSGLSVLAQLRKDHARIGTVALTMFESDAYRTAALNAGANAFVTKRMLNQQLVTAIEEAYNIVQS